MGSARVNLLYHGIVNAFGSVSTTSGAYVSLLIHASNSARVLLRKESRVQLVNQSGPANALVSHRTSEETQFVRLVEPNVRRSDP